MAPTSLPSSKRLHNHGNIFVSHRKINELNGHVPVEIYIDFPIKKNGGFLMIPLLKKKR